MGRDQNDQETRLAALKRAYGPLPDEQEAMTVGNERFDDWRGVCRHCGEALEGTARQLKEHNCGS